MKAATRLSVNSVRNDFPMYTNQATADIAYLDSAATSHKPNEVLAAITSYYVEANSNVHRAVHSLATESTRRYEEARSNIARFIGASSVEEIIFTSGATESINLVASSFGQTLESGDIIILSEMEHHANLIPWQFLSKRGVELRFLRFDEEGRLDLDDLEALWSDRVRMVSLTHVSNVLGTINDVRGIADYAHARGVPALVDAAQSVPHQRVNVEELGCDFLAFSGHKMYGPTGTGVLFGKRSRLLEMEPYKGGGEMIQSVWLDRATWNDLPYRFEAGTPNIAGAVALGAAVNYLEGLGMDAVRNHEREITEYALSALDSVDGLTIFGPRSERGSVISFIIDDIHAHDVAQFLDSEGVAVRPGHHCAQPIMRKLGVSATVRVSFGVYTIKKEIDRLVSAIEKTKDFFHRGI